MDGHCLWRCGQIGQRQTEIGWLNIPQGRVRASELSFAVDLDAAEGVQKVYDVEGQVEVREAHFKWSKMRI